MTDFADRWQTADDEEYDPADGPYTVRVEEGSAFESKDGREFCKLTLRVIDGGMDDAKGRAFDHFMTLSNPDALRMSKAALRMYGVDVGQVRDLEDLDGQVAALEGAEAEITVAHKNGYLNITVHSTIPSGGEAGPPAAPPRPPAAPAGDEDDIPF